MVLHVLVMIYLIYLHTSFDICHCIELIVAGLSMALEVQSGLTPSTIAAVILDSIICTFI